MLFINGTGKSRGGVAVKKTLMSLELEELFKNHPNITFKSMTQQEIEQIETLATVYPNHHILIDEFVVRTEKLTPKQMEETKKKFSALTRNFKSAWIVLSR